MTLPQRAAKSLVDACLILLTIQFYDHHSLFGSMISLLVNNIWDSLFVIRSMMLSDE